MVIGASAISLPESNILYMIFGNVSINPIVATIIVYIIAFLWYFGIGRKNVCSFEEEFERLKDI